MKQRYFEHVNEDFRKNKTLTQLPTRASSKSAGYDFYMPCDLYLGPRATSDIIPTDIKAHMQDDEVLMLYIRSSVGIKKGITLANGTGVIDSDYYSNPDNDGNIGIALQNNNDYAVCLPKGERIMQGVFIKYLTTDDDETSAERIGGFGSSGEK